MMPFHLSPRKHRLADGSPSGSRRDFLVPIVTDPVSGTRSIRLAFMVGPDFTDDDVTVDVTEARVLTVSASYGAEIGFYGTEVNSSNYVKHQPYRMRQMFSNTLLVVANS
jgi:hypothetical protein